MGKKIVKLASLLIITVILVSACATDDSRQPESPQQKWESRNTAGTGEGADTPSPSDGGTDAHIVETIIIETAIIEPEPGFFYPIRTQDELDNLGSQLLFTNFADKYIHYPSVKIERLVELNDILWLNGNLIVADSKAIYVLDNEFNILDRIDHTPVHQRISAFALTSGSDGRLHAVINKVSVKDGTEYSIITFDNNFSYENEIKFTLKNVSGMFIKPKSIACNPNGGFVMTISGSFSGEGYGKLYMIAEDGSVTVGPGSESQGYLLGASDSIYFLNSDFPMVTFQDGFIGDYGLSALFKLQDNNVTKRVIIPPVTYLPPGDAEVHEEILRLYEEIYGKPPTPEYSARIRKRGYIGGNNGCGGLFYMPDGIAVVVDIGFFVFDEDLNYLYTQPIYDDAVKSFIDRHNGKVVMSFPLAACADDSGNIYYAVRTMDMSISGGYYGIKKISLKSVDNGD